MIIEDAVAYLFIPLHVWINNFNSTHNHQSEMFLVAEFNHIASFLSTNNFNMKDT